MVKNLTYLYPPKKAKIFLFISGSPSTVEYGYSIGIHHGDGYSYQTRSGFDIYNSIFANHHSTHKS